MARSVVRSTARGIAMVTTETGKVVHESTRNGFPLCGKRIMRGPKSGGGIWYTDEAANCPNCEAAAVRLGWRESKP